MIDQEDSLHTALNISLAEVADVVMRAHFINSGQAENQAQAEALANPDLHGRWTEAVEQLFEIYQRVLAGKGAVAISWMQLRRMVQAVVTQAAVPDEQSEKEDRLWEASARQAVNLISAELQSEFDEARDHDWRGWIKDPFSKTGLDDDPDIGETVEGDFDDE
jgi:hypothetical protein